jgi:rhomboid protease GluP
VLKDIKIKIKEIYLPFLCIAIGTILFYNFFRWTFDIKLDLIPLKKDLLNFWIPAFLPWIPILIWLRRKIRILAVRGKQDNGHFGYQFAMVIAIAIPIIISQNYIEKGSYELIEVDSANEIKNFKGEKYFKINTFQIDKESSLPYVTSLVSGKYDDKLTFYLYLACPFQNIENVWYGIDYQKRVSNNISDSEKEKAYQRFVTKSEETFISHVFQNALYFEKMVYSDDRDRFIRAVKDKQSQLIDADQIILTPQLDPFDERLGSTFFWIFASFGIGALILLIMIVIPKIDELELQNFKANKPLKEDDLKYFLEFLDPRGEYKATSVLILLNITAFVIMTFYGISINAPTTIELLEIGGNRRNEVMNGEYWRLFTSIFIHAGFSHLLMNLFGLGLSGYFLDPILSRTQLILSFILCGLLASLASIFWYENTVSVGASGAIFGWYGLIFAFSFFKIYPDDKREMAWALVAISLGLSFFYGLFNNIDNAAPVGGLISGFILGSLFILKQKDALIQKAR